MVRRTGEENRRNILEVATGLFYRQGIRAVGMDAVIKACGVGNATVYRQFPTKDDLATAVSSYRYLQLCWQALGWDEEPNRRLKPRLQRPLPRPPSRKSIPAAVSPIWKASRTI